MHNMSNPQRRGKKIFEPWLKELFLASGLKAEGSFTRKAPDEELDGSIQEGLTTFLLEAKWEKAPINAHPVSIFHNKIQRGTIGTYGILISVTGFNENAVRTVGEMKPIRQLLIDRSHLEALLEQKINGNIWINTLVKIASLHAKPFISIEDILNENKIFSPLILKKSENLNKHLNDSNPFQPGGTLPEDAPSYIKRECDYELAKLIKSNKKKLIAIHGEFEIGKSSLMNRVMHVSFLSNNDWKRYKLDLQSLCPSEMENFKEYFFKHYSSKLNSTIDSWKDMDLFLKNQPVVLCIDEFGGFIDHPKVAKHFIQNLCLCTQNSNNIRIVVCLKQPIEDFFDNSDLKQYFENPKYRRCWENIAVKPFTEDQAKQLLSLLKEEVQSIALENISIIKAFSSFKPHKLQCLCDRLFDAFSETGDESILIDIINNEASYS